MEDRLLRTFINEKFIELLKKHIPEKNIDIEGRFEASIKTIRSPSFTIPVLGVQGSGKSSLLNAILLNDLILPVDADETTCIPSEIRYGENETPQAEAIFKDGSSEKIECSEMGLKPFVHQANNPSNVKSIDRISIKIQHPLLESGVVFVDLPGVGSITRENLVTTQKYMKEAYSAIFLLRTVPPITNSEAVFIQGIWPLLISTFFIQNQWSDERDDEVEDGRDHNLNVLKKIAERCRIPSDDLQIEIVSVANALKAAVKKDEEMLSKSGLNRFTEKLKEFVEDWRSHSLNQIEHFLFEIIKSARKEIHVRIESAQMDAAERLEELKAARKKFQEELDDKKDTVSSLYDFIQDEKKELKKEISRICDKAAENFRNKMRDVIDTGVTGGSFLNQAFSDNYQEQLDHVFGEIQPLVLRTFQMVSERLSDIGDFSFNKVDLDIKPDFENQSNMHSFYQPAGSSAGGLGGTVGGVKVGAWVGTWLLPGVGTIVGGIAGGIVGGIAGSLFGNWLGKKSQEKHLDSQQETARNQVFSLIDEFKKEVSKHYKNLIDDHIRTLKEKMDQWFLYKEKEFERLSESIGADVAKTDSEKQSLLEELKLDMDELNKIETSLRT